MMRFSRSDSVLIVSHTHTQSLLSVIFLPSACKCQACLLWSLLGLVKQESSTQTQFPLVAFMPCCGCSHLAEVAQQSLSHQLIFLALVVSKQVQTPAEAKLWHLTARWQAELEGSYLLSPFQRSNLQEHKTESKFHPLPAWDLFDPCTQQHSCEVPRPQTHSTERDTELSLLSDWASAWRVAGGGWGHVAIRPMGNPSTSLSREALVRTGEGKRFSTHKAAAWLLSTSGLWVNHF